MSSFAVVGLVGRAYGISAPAQIFVIFGILTSSSFHCPRGCQIRRPHEHRPRRRDFFRGDFAVYQGIRRRFLGFRGGGMTVPGRVSASPIPAPIWKNSTKPNHFRLNLTRFCPNGSILQECRNFECFCPRHQYPFILHAQKGAGRPESLGHHP